MQRRLEQALAAAGCGAQAQRDLAALQAASRVRRRAAAARAAWSPRVTGGHTLMKRGVYMRERVPAANLRDLPTLDCSAQRRTCLPTVHAGGAR